MTSPMWQAPYIIRLFEKDDMEEILSAFQGPAGISISRAHWEWQYMHNPAAEGKACGIIAEDRKTGEIAGFLFSTPWRLRQGDKDIYATIGSHAYVRPQYRGKGLYNLMIHEGLLKRPDIQGEVRFIFYNETTRHARSSAPGILDTSISLNLRNPQKIISHLFADRLPGRILLCLHRAYQSCRMPAKDGSLTLQKGDIESASEVYHEWSKRSHYIHTYRNIQYLRWRFQEDPNGVHRIFMIQRNGKVRGYFIVNLDERFGEFPFRTLIISDYIIHENDPEIFGQGVRGLLVEFGDVDLVLARAFATPGYQKKLREIGCYDSLAFPLKLWIKPGSMSVRAYSADLSGVEDRENWYLTCSDCF